MDNVVQIRISEKFHPNLAMNAFAKNLFNEINNSDETYYIIDFEDVIFMSRSFTQEYLFQKLKTKKIIDEINVPESINGMFNVVKKILPLVSSGKSFPIT